MATTMLLLALKSLLVAGATLLLLRLTRTRSAAERSTIAHLGLFGLVALPLATLALPQIAVPLPSPVAGLAAPREVTRIAPADAYRAYRAVTMTPVSSDPAPAPSHHIIGAMARYAFLVPTLALLMLTLVALLRLTGLRSRAEVLVDPDWLSALARAQRRMKMKNGTALLKSDELESPISWGLMRPTILLSERAVLAPGQAEAIIAHELAHVVHLDWLKLILARVATAAFWFNPLAWVLAREAHQLREEAADDAVLAADIAGPDYAELLIGAARHQGSGALLGAHGVAPSKSSLGRRVHRVLDRACARRPAERSWIAGFATGMLCMGVPVAALSIAPSTAFKAPVGKARVGDATVSPPALSDEMGDATAGDLVDEQAIDHVVQADVSRVIGRQVPDRAGRRHPPRREEDESDEVDQLIGMRAVGVTADDQRAMAAAGFPGLTASQLTSARAVGMTPAYARSMRAAGIRGSFEDLIGARATGLDPAYVAAMRQLGVTGSFDDFQGMRAVDVTPAFVRSLRARGISTIAPDKLIALAAVGVGRDP